MNNYGIDKFANIYYRKDGTEAVRYKKEIHNYVQNHRNEIINMLKELVKIPSIQSKPEEGAPFGRACAEVLEYVKSCWQKMDLIQKFIRTTAICCHTTVKERKA